MLARLWWKEARQFGPIWLVVALAAMVNQWWALRAFGSDGGDGMLFGVALVWTGLYAFAVAAAAFAAERENRTLGFLDALGVNRGQLWVAKAAFALVTTAALAAVLGALAWLGTGSIEKGLGTWMNRPGAVRAAVLGGIKLLLEMLGWGLFWSAVLRSALHAAVLAMASVFLVVSSIEALFRLHGDYLDTDSLRLTVALATIAASAFWFVLTSPPGGAGRGVRSTTGEATVGATSRERVGRPARFWPPAVARLVWLTIRQGWPVWWKLALISLGVPLAYAGLEDSADIWGIALALNLLVGLIAGVSLFGVENRERTHRVLAHHAVRPGLVWGVKTAVGLAAMGLIWLPLAGAMLLRHPSEWARGGLLFWGILVGSVAVGQLCGMALIRELTACVIGVVAMLALLAPLGGLDSAGMLPHWVALAVPLALLAVGWAWSGDWLLARPGLARWGRLSLWLVLAFLALLPPYIASRAWSIPQLAETTAAQLDTFARPPASGPEAEETGRLYRRAAQRLGSRPIELSDEVIDPFGDRPSVPQIVAEGEGPQEDRIAAYLRGRRDTLDLIRRAAAQPECRLLSLDRLTLFDGQDIPNLDPVARLVALSVRERQASGDLDGAWDDIMTLLRMARHWTGPVPASVAVVGLAAERQALLLAMDWADDPRQTPERLRDALEAYRTLPPMPAVADTIRAEAVIARNTLEMPVSELRDELPRFWTGQSAVRWESFAVDAFTTPWELTRARRASRLAYASSLLWAEIPTDRRILYGLGRADEGSLYVPVLWCGHEAGWESNPESLNQLTLSTPLVRWVAPPLPSTGLLRAHDENEAARRALVQVLALRRWQLRHGGQMPTSLADLVPSELDALPGDPFSIEGKQPFGYIQSSGQPVQLLGDLAPERYRGPEIITPEPGSWLLYSIGPDGRDDRGRRSRLPHPQGEDIVFQLRPSPPDARNAVEPSR